MTLKAAGATQQEINTIETMIETNKQKKKHGTMILLKLLPNIYHLIDWKCEGTTSHHVIRSSHTKNLLCT